MRTPIAGPRSRNQIVANYFLSDAAPLLIDSINSEPKLRANPQWNSMVITLTRAPNAAQKSTK
jgi:hypothetical protein